MRVPAQNHLLLPGSSGDFPPVFHQYTSVIKPDDEARAIHWITSYAYYALCAPHETLGCPLSHPTLWDPQPHLPLPEVLTEITCAKSV
jgi:hypothetical protein